MVVALPLDSAEAAGAVAIASALEAVRTEIVSAKNDGQATGVAMKHLKGLSLNAQGQDVTAVVKQMRAAK